MEVSVVSANELKVKASEEKLPQVVETDVGMAAQESGELVRKEAMYSHGSTPSNEHRNWFSQKRLICLTMPRHFP